MSNGFANPVGFANPGRWDAGTLDAGIPIRSKFWSENLSIGAPPRHFLARGFHPWDPDPVPCLTADTQGSWIACRRPSAE